MRTIRMVLPAVAACAMTAANGVTHMDRSRLNIGAWRLSGNARTEAHVKDLKDCGVDFVVTPLDRATLALFAKYGIGCFLRREEVPLWHGGGHPDSGKMHLQRPLSLYDPASTGFEDHPAIWGLYIGDEPSALDMSHFGRVVARMAPQYPDKVIFLNLFPDYALPEGERADRISSQLGAASYVDYIAEYCRSVPLDYISYDHYPWGWGNKPLSALRNLAVVADACAGTRRSLWVVMQSSQHVEGDSKRAMTVGTLRFQANTALAYGAEALIWACWSRAWGGWEGTVLDASGRKTGVYDSLKQVNLEAHRLSPQYMRFRWTHSDLIGFSSAEEKTAGQPSLLASCGESFRDVKAVDGAPIVVGHFVSRVGDGSHAVYVVACDDPDDANPRVHTVAFRSALPSVEAFAGDRKVALKRKDDGSFAFSIGSNCGVLVVAAAKKGM